MIAGEAAMASVDGAAASDPPLPLGGVRASGPGRELGGGYGLPGLAGTQTVWEQPGGRRGG